MIFKRQKAVHLGNYVHETLVKKIKSIPRDEAIAVLVQTAFDHGYLLEKEAFLNAVLHREKIASTGIGLSVAIPHAKTDFIHEFFIVIGIVEGEGIAWESLDQNPVHLIFLIGGPKNEQSHYLQILSRLTEIIRDEKAQESMIHAKDAKEVISYFERY